jgi:hypothetical protein
MKYDIATLTPWGAPVRVKTRNGERNLRKATSAGRFQGAVDGQQGGAQKAIVVGKLVIVANNRKAGGNPRESIQKWHRVPRTRLQNHGRFIPPVTQEGPQFSADKAVAQVQKAEYALLPRLLPPWHWELLPF